MSYLTSFPLLFGVEQGFKLGIPWKGDYNPNLNGETVDKDGKKMVLGSQRKNDIRMVTTT